MSIIREATKIISRVEMRIRRSKKLPFSNKYVFRLIRGDMRAKIVMNGGATNPNGKAEIASINTNDFLSVTAVPKIKFEADYTSRNIAETKNPVLDKWYQYDFWTHRLTPLKEVYILRTAKGDYVKFQIVDYYCGKIAGCYAIRYVYQGSGSTSFTG